MLGMLLFAVVACVVGLIGSKILDERFDRPTLDKRGRGLNASQKLRS